MADNSVPVWVPVFSSSLTFIGGLLSGQLAEHFRAKRDRQTSREARQLKNLDERISRQRNALIELQETAQEATKGFIFLINNRVLIDAPEPLVKEVYTASESQRAMIWRWGILASRVTNPQVRQDAFAFGNLFTASRVFFREVPASDAVSELISALNALNKSIGVAFRELDEEIVLSN